MTLEPWGPLQIRCIFVNLGSDAHKVELVLLAFEKLRLHFMLQLRKQSITELPHNLIATMTEVELSDFCEKNKLNRYESWLLPQLVAAFGSWTLVKAEGKPDVRLTLKHNCEGSLEAQAYWRLSRVPRQMLVTKQIAVAEYATLTPLILAGFKRMQGVAYESWRDCAGLDYVVEPRLFEAVALDGDLPNLGSERLLEIRTQGLTTRSGKSAGQLKNAETTWSLNGISDTELGHLPKLTQSILTQIWLAHPVHRHNLMILDPQNWDRMPEPLIAPTIFKQPVKESAALDPKPNQSTKSLLPWM